jgi:hypothetical protein
MYEESLPKKNGMVSIWNMKKGKSPEFVGAGSNNWSEREWN